MPFLGEFEKREGCGIFHPLPPQAGDIERRLMFAHVTIMKTPCKTVSSSGGG